MTDILEVQQSNVCLNINISECDGSLISACNVELSKEHVKDCASARDPSSELIGHNVGEDKLHSWLDNVSELNTQILNIFKTDIGQLCSISVNSVQVKDDPDRVTVTKDDVGHLLGNRSCIGRERPEAWIEYFTE